MPFGPQTLFGGPGSQAFILKIDREAERELKVTPEAARLDGRVALGPFEKQRQTNHQRLYVKLPDDSVSDEAGLSVRAPQRGRDAPQRQLSNGKPDAFAHGIMAKPALA